MGELENLAAPIERAIMERFAAAAVAPCEVSVWIKLVRLVGTESGQAEETLSPIHKGTFRVASLPDLVHQLTENLVLAAFGGDTQWVENLPNLIVRLFDRKQVVAVPGAPPLDQPGQVYLKATVYKSEPSLLDRLFGKKADA